MSEGRLRADMVALARRMVAEGYSHGRAGNLSARLPDGNLLTTPAGVLKSELSPQALVVVDLGGTLLQVEPGWQPTSELPMHLEVYRQRPDVGAVIHAHPLTCIALSLVGISMEEPFIPEALVLLGPVPTTPYATPSSEENRAAIAGLIGHHDALILAHHGSLTVGGDLGQAYERLETLEHTARIVALAHQLGQPRRISQENLEKLLDLRARYAAAAPVGELQARIAAAVEEMLLRVQ